MPLTRIFGSTQPVSTDLVGAGYTNLDDLSDDISERMTLDHYMDGELTDDLGDQDGRHRQVTMYKTTEPTEKVDTGILYTKKDGDDITRLYFIDSNGEVTKLSTSGPYSSSIIISGTWTCPESRYYLIHMVGAGGDGGVQSVGGGAGGGAGAYGRKKIWIEEEDIWTIAFSSTNSGNSTISNGTTTLSVENGSNGVSLSSGQGGNETSGFDFSVAGGDGAVPHTTLVGGSGGASFFGGGGAGYIPDGNAARDGEAYGSGGGGGGVGSSGASGLILIEGA